MNFLFASTSLEEHQRIRDIKDRSSTFRLLEEVRGESTNPGERSEAFRTLGYLEDYRSIGPVTEIAENADLSTDLREEASVVLSGFDLTSTLLNAIRRLGLPEPDVPDLFEIDNLHAHPAVR